MSKEKRSQKIFLGNNKFGLIVRTFSDLEGVQKRADSVKNLIEKALKIKAEGGNVFSRIDILVWADSEFKESDCGETAETLKKVISFENVFVHNVEQGDLFCSLLNQGIFIQTRNGIDYSMIISPEAESYFNNKTVGDMIEAVQKGALATGVAIDELADSVMEGRLANTFAMWNNKALRTVRGFDLLAAKSKDDNSAPCLKSWNEDNGFTSYPLAGVEEVIPLAKMVELYGPCIAPILPTGEGVERYKTPDSRMEPELWKRHESKIATKTERQVALLAQTGFTLSFLKGGVMEEYR